MASAIRSYLELVRLPNLPTAAADSLAGWLVAVGSFASPSRWLALMGASMAIYAAGIALNDVFDYRIDLDERPGRPLPSGRVSRRVAATLGVALLVVGLGLASTTGARGGLVASALVGAVLAYDGVLKRTPVGPISMGSCRALNFALGLSGAADLGGPSSWWVAGALGAFVAGITWISRSEVRSGERVGVAWGTLVEAAALAGLAALSIGRARAPGGLGAGRHIGLALLAAVAGVVLAADARALRAASPATLQRAVKTGVLGLVWLDVAIVASARGPIPALAVAALWPPAFLAARWLYST